MSKISKVASSGSNSVAARKRALLYEPALKLPAKPVWEPDAIIEKTAYIYRKSQERGLTRRRSVSALLAAAIYIVCRQMGVPRTLDDIAIISNIKRKSIAKCYRQIIIELDLKLPMIDTTKCIARVANKVNISEKTKHQAINLMNDVVNSG
jgi:transcription initiation factor TFIIB